MKRLFSSLVAICTVGALAGCSSVRVKLSGDREVRYQAAWTTTSSGTTTRSGVVPASFSFDGDVTGWFQNATGSGEFRVRVYEGMGLLVDETLDGSARRFVIERKGRAVRFRME